MNFEYSDEQQQLADSLGKYLASQYDFEKRKAIINSASGLSDSAWATGEPSSSAAAESYCSSRPSAVSARFVANTMAPSSSISASISMYSDIGKKLTQRREDARTARRVSHAKTHRAQS